MPRKRLVYTDGGKPIPGGPIEVEVDGPVRTSSEPRELDVSKPAPKPQPAQSGSWTDYEE